MHEGEVPLNAAMRDPADVACVDIPAAPDITFNGFSFTAFEILARLRAHPHIRQYQEEKAGIRTHIKDPFRAYRDDLVVNLVLPNRIELETERNVFSRLLKNDFGAGGCHHHFWMSFYRPRRTRLTDIQLAHSLYPEGLRVAVFAGKQAADAFETARARVVERFDRFRELVDAVLTSGSYELVCIRKGGERSIIENKLPETAIHFQDAEGFSVRRIISAEEVLRKEGRVLAPVLNAVKDLWPVYRFLL